MKSGTCAEINDSQHRVLDMDRDLLPGRDRRRARLAGVTQAGEAGRGLPFADSVGVRISERKHDHRPFSVWTERARKAVVSLGRHCLRCLQGLRNVGLGFIQSEHFERGRLVGTLAQAQALSV